MALYDPFKTAVNQRQLVFLPSQTTL